MIDENDNRDEAQLRKMASDIAAHDVELLVHPPGAGPLSFEELRFAFQAIKEFYKNLSVSNLRAISDAKFPQMKDLTLGIINHLNQIKLFDIARTTNPSSFKSELVQNINSTWQQIYNYSAVDVAFARISSIGFDKEILMLRSTIEELKAEWQKAAKDYTEQKTTDKEIIDTEIQEMERALAEKVIEVDKALEIARTSTLFGTVASQAREFENEAKDCLKASYSWLTATVVIVVISAIVAWQILIVSFHHPLTNFITNIPPLQPSALNQLHPLTNAIIQVPIASEQSVPASAAKTAIIIQEVAARIFIITLLFSVVAWCARNYFASRHNFTVNRHRRNAMQTFRAFVEATKDPSTQNFILKQAASCAFSPQQTGYLKDESLPTPAPSTQMMEVIRPASGGQ